MDVLNTLAKEKYINQRRLAAASGHSLGVVNRSLRELSEHGYIDSDIRLTDKAKKAFEDGRPKNAVILAAGFGMRMVPINMEVPKGLLEVNGEPLIERTIRQLNSAGIKEIYIVVGFMKESYEYLIDEYGVELIVNNEYASKNNLYSLNLVSDKISNTYIIPCDIWCDINPYSQNELYSWYMVSDMVDDESNVRVNRKMELVSVANGTGGNAMLGISYLLKDDADKVKRRMELLCSDRHNAGMFWEEALYQNKGMIVKANVVHATDVVEINTYEQLRELDKHSGQLENDAIETICQALSVKAEEIVDITVLKKGMTNRSFLFSTGGKKYIMRIPGEGTAKFINRRQEADVYMKVSGKGICDDIAYINPDNGYKITRFIDGARVCDPKNKDDLRKCMKKLRKFHELKLRVDHEFDIFDQIGFYESLWNGEDSVFRDYKETKKNVFSLKRFIDENVGEKVLSHIDAVPDNFLFSGDGQETDLRLIDWEYAAMQDPHVDIAMFCIYSFYDKKQIDELIDIYFDGECDRNTRIKIYCYISAAGLLWSNWCEYKRTLGVEFGEYSLKQYRYAKEYYKIVQEELNEEQS